jgi:hypothetical protein
VASSGKLLVAARRDKGGRIYRATLSSSHCILDALTHFNSLFLEFDAISSEFGEASAASDRNTHAYWHLRWPAGWLLLLLLLVTRTHWLVVGLSLVTGWLLPVSRATCHTRYHVISHHHGKYSRR